jgi:hypothetical protein
MNQQKPDQAPEPPPDTKKVADTKKSATVVGVIVVGLACLASIPAAYFLVAWLIGYLDDTTVTWGYLVGGLVLTWITLLVVMVMGESVIEDMVKFVMFLVGAIAIASTYDPIIGAIAIGAPIGAGLPLILRRFTN